MVLRLIREHVRERREQLSHVDIVWRGVQITRDNHCVAAGVRSLRARIEVPAML